MNMSKGVGIYSSCGSNLNSIPEINSNIGSERDLELGDGGKTERVRNGETWRERRDRILRLEKKEMEVAKRNRLRREEEEAHCRGVIALEVNVGLRERIIEEGLKEKREEGGEEMILPKEDGDPRFVENIIKTEAKVDALNLNSVEGDGKKVKRKVYFNKKFINSLKEIMWNDKKDNSSCNSNNDIDHQSSNCTDNKSNIDIIISNSNDNSNSNSSPNGSHHNDKKSNDIINNSDKKNNDITNNNSKQLIKSNLSKDVIIGKNEMRIPNEIQIESNPKNHPVVSNNYSQNPNIFNMKNTSNQSDKSTKSFFSRPIWPATDKPIFSSDVNIITKNQNSSVSTNTKFDFFSHFFGTLPMLRRNRELNYFIVEITDSSGLGADEVRTSFSSIIFIIVFIIIIGTILIIAVRLLVFYIGVT